MKILNLASRPFENRRPVRRIAGMLWLAGSLVMALNLWLFWDHLTGFATTTGQLSEVRDQIARETEEIGRLGEAVAALSLEEQNEEVETLNRLITDRAFPWGLLFDRLENVLPDQVWLAAVQPRRAKAERGASSRRRSGQRSRGRKAAGADDGVVLVLRGQARDSAALRSFVDRLFADPVFRNPQLRNQAIGQSGDRDFNLEVLFLVGAAQALMDTGGGEAQQQASAEENGSPLMDTEEEAHAAAAGFDDEDDEGVASAQVQPLVVVPSATVPPPEDLRTMVGSNVVPSPSSGVARGVVREPSQREPSQRATRERGTLRTRESRSEAARQATTAPPATTVRTPSNTVAGVPIIPAPSIVPPATPAPGTPAAPRTTPSTTPPSTTRPATIRPATPRPTSPDRSEIETPAPGQTPPAVDDDPSRIDADDLEPIPPSSPASSSARIRGGRR